MKYYRLNNQIIAPEVRLLNEEGKNLGIVKTYEAIRMAQEKGLTLVEVDPKASPPVAKIIDFGQFKYETQKRERKNRSKIVETKIIRLSLRIGKHDLEYKIKQSLKFLSIGHKVKIEMVLKGREKIHLDLAKKIIQDFIRNLDEGIKIEQPINYQGGRLKVLISR